MIGRRQFITLLGGAAAWPLVARAEQRAVPVIGFLNVVSPEMFAGRLQGFHRGLKDAGYVEGENIEIIYRWAENQVDRLPELAADLVRRQVAVIAATGGTASALSAKLATTTIPIVFGVPEDPVKLGLVASLARPGGNLTGINFFIGELAAKQLGLLREIVPTAARIAVLTNPANVRASATAVAEVEAAARTMGLQTQVFNASTHALGWTEGKNLRIDWYWTAGDVGRIRSDVAGLARHPPDIIVANGRVTLSEALQVIRSIPIVFVLVTDPVGQGFISSLARPGGNVTGFTFFEYAMFGKSLELLKKVAPAVTRVGFIFNPDMSAYYDQFLPDSRRMPGSIRSS